jgi:pimeloyl-ACP methyl ester carboxylesterase
MRPTMKPRRRHRDGFQSRWTLVKGVGMHHRESLDGPAERCPVVFVHGLALDHVTLLANSFGCQVAVDLAVRHPNRVRSLVLVGPTTDPRDVRDAGVRRVAATFRQSLDDPIEAKLPLVAVPTLVVRGGLDPVVPQRWAETAARLAPLGELVVVPGAPHNVNYSAADRLAPIVCRFLATSGRMGPKVGDP